MRTSVLLLSVALLLPGCRQQHDSANRSAQTVTHTIAPAEGKPAAMSGTDAMTQTVEIGDGRSEAEGGAAAGPSNTAPPAKKAPAKKKHQ